MKVCLTIGVLFLVLQSTAQTNDYLVTVTGDTLKFPIKANYFGGGYRYSTTDKKKHKIQPEEIKEFYLAADTMLHRAIKVAPASHPVFVEVLEDGKIKLYERSIQSKYGVTVYWYVSSDNVPLTLIKTNGFEAASRDSRKALLNRMMAGDMEALKGINDKGLTYEDVRSSIKIYNKNHTGTPGLQ